MATHSSILAWEVSWTEQSMALHRCEGKFLEYRSCLVPPLLKISLLLLLLLLSRFSRVRLCATPEMAAHQAPPSLGFSRQEHWSGLPFPSPMQEREK